MVTTATVVSTPAFLSDFWTKVSSLALRTQRRVLRSEIQTGSVSLSWTRVCVIGSFVGLQL